MTTTHYPYLIVGGGMTADAAVRGIREIDADTPIGLIAAERHPPYNRPPLSKGLWAGQALDDIWRETHDLGVDLHLGREARELDPTNRTVTDDAGAVYTFDKLLLATGGTPRKLDPNDDITIYFRTLDDYRHLRKLSDRADRFVVIGGGFIGSEIAAALATQGRSVTLIVRERGIGANIYPESLSTFLTDYYRQQGVTVATDRTVIQVTREGRQIVVHTRSGEQFETDGVVAGLGLIPNTNLARMAGLDVDNGVHVDTYLRTGHPDIFAAGDVANFYQPALARRMRVEHEDNANTMGLHAGRAMAGRLEPYEHLPYVYSDLFDLGFEAVGVLDSRLETSSDWQEPHRKGIVTYLKDGRIHGVLLWNLWGQRETARGLIMASGSEAAAAQRELQT